MTIHKVRIHFVFSFDDESKNLSVSLENGAPLLQMADPKSPVHQKMHPAKQWLVKTAVLYAGNMMEFLQAAMTPRAQEKPEDKPVENDPIPSISA